MGDFMALERVGHHILVPHIDQLERQLGEGLEGGRLDVRQHHALTGPVQGEGKLGAELPGGPDDEVDVLGHDANMSRS